MPGITSGCLISSSLPMAPRKTGAVTCLPFLCFLSNMFYLQSLTVPAPRKPPWISCASVPITVDVAFIHPHLPVLTTKLFCLVIKANGSSGSKAIYIYIYSCFVCGPFLLLLSPFAGVSLAPIISQFPLRQAPHLIIFQLQYSVTDLAHSGVGS